MSTPFWRAPPVSAVMAATTLLIATSALAQSPAADAIANRFSPEAEAAAAAESARTEAERRKAEETDILERARAEARDREEAERQAREVEEAKARLAREEVERAKAEAERVASEARAEEERRAAEAERAVTEAQEAKFREEAEREARRLAETDRALRDAKALAAKAAEARKTADAERLAVEEARAREAERAAAAEAARQAEEARTVAEQEAKREAETQAKAEADEAAEQSRLANARDEEAARLSEKLKRVREQRAGEMALGAAPATEQTKGAQPASPAADQSPLKSRITAATETQVNGAAARPTTVTVVLVMDPGTYGIRRGNKTADPVLCVGTTCYVSTGPGSAARKMTRGAALGPFNTLGGRAGKCRGSLSCVFRGVDLAAGLVLQPVDLHVLKHDKREAQAVEADLSCRVAASRLACSNVVQGKGWRALVVPEDVAQDAGPEVLEAARSGLAGPVRDARVQ